MTLEQGFGAALVLLFLADIFLTVLYARAGTGLIGPNGRGRSGLYSAPAPRCSAGGAGRFCRLPGR